MWLCCLLIVCSCYSQDRWADSTGNYPCYIYLHGDTLGAFTLVQMRRIAATYVRLDECDSISGQLMAERDGRRLLDQKSDSLIHSYQELALHDEGIFRAYQLQEKLNTDEMASMRRQNKLDKIKARFLGVGIGIPLTSGIAIGSFFLGVFLKPKL